MLPTLTSDQLAGLALVYGTKAEQAKIFQQIKHANGDLCPRCGGTDIDHNGADRHDDLEFECRGCTDADGFPYRWLAAEVEVELPARCPAKETT